MSIEIIGRTNSPTFIKPPPKAEVDGEKKVAVPNTVKSDSIALTSVTQEIKKAFGSSSASPIDSGRVDTVKKALADGSYSIDAKQVAKKLVQFEAAFISRQE